VPTIFINDLGARRLRPKSPFPRTSTKAFFDINGAKLDPDNAEAIKRTPGCPKLRLRWRAIEERCLLRQQCGEPLLRNKPSAPSTD
jgi:hypothetical protein